MLEALRIAEVRGLDLIEIAATAVPPVAKIMDYGKWKYEEERKERESKTKRREIEIKGIRFGIATSRRDMEVKAAKAKGFLEAGNKVQVEVVLRGRAKGTHVEFAKRKFMDFLKLFPFPIVIEEDPKKGMRGLVAVIIKGGDKRQHA